MASYVYILSAELDRIISATPVSVRVLHDFGNDVIVAKPRTHDVINSCLKRLFIKSVFVLEI